MKTLKVLALVSPILLSSLTLAGSPGSLTIPLDPIQLQPRSDRTNTTQNALDMIMGLNSTLLKYNESPLAPLPGVELRPSTQGTTDSRSGTISTARRAIPFRPQPAAGASASLDIFNEHRLPFGRSAVGASVPSISTLFDTGISTYLVPGHHCLEDGGCRGNIKYAEGGFDTGEDVDVAFNSVNTARISARRFRDTVSVAGLEAQGVDVSSVRSASSDYLFVNGNTAAVLGLAGGARGQPSYIESLVQAGSLPRNEFSFYFGRERDGSLQHSELTIGGSNIQRFQGYTTTIARTIPNVWSVHLSSVRCGPSSWRTAYANMYIDSTGQNMVFPANAAFDAVMAQVPESFGMAFANMFHSQSHLYVAPCSAQFYIALQLEDGIFAVDHRDLLGDQVDMDVFIRLGYEVPAALQGPRRVCKVQVIGSTLHSAVGQAIAGLPFLKAWHTTFNLDGVGSITLAKSRP